MKRLLMALTAVQIFVSCTTSKNINDAQFTSYALNQDPPLSRSLFTSDKGATISEGDIQAILDAHIKLPEKLRVVFAKLESAQIQRRYYWSNEQHLKAQQQYADLFAVKFKQSQRVVSVATLPELLLSNSPSFTNIREAAVRTQSDIVAVYTINSDIYNHFKTFGKTTIKAYATIQMIILDVRTGLIPFTTIVTKDFQDKKNETDLSEDEAMNRIKNEAVLLAISTIGDQVTAFLKSE